MTLLPAEPRRIAFVGDTGCRLDRWDGYQACNDPAAWPFAQVAAAIAAWQPDLIVHVGDYVYREDPCPAGNAGCAGSPYGDTWATWDADFFAPVGPALGAAPWLFLRGNHEMCDREGIGWFRLLDPRPLPTACERFTAPYATAAGPLRFVVLDAAESGDERSSPEEDAAYGGQFSRLEELVAAGSWLLSHKAMRGLLFENDEEREVQVETFSEAFDSRLPAGINLALAGHLHQSQALEFVPGIGRTSQLVTGNGGTALDSGVSAVYSGAQVGDAALESGTPNAGFGFLGLERSQTGTGWLVTAWDLNGGARFACSIVGAAMNCAIP